MPLSFSFLKNILFRFATLMLIFACYTFTTFAQPYGNEWFEANKDYLYININSDGLYKVSKYVFDSSGLDTEDSFIQLWSHGNQIPIHLEDTNNDGQWNFLYFFGERNKGEKDNSLFIASSHHVNQDFSLFSDDRTYYFATTYNENNVLQYENINTSLLDAPFIEQTMQTDRIEFNNTFNDGEPYILANVVNHFSEFSRGEGFISSSFNENIIVYKQVQLPYLNTNDNELVTLKFNILGKSNNLSQYKDHQVQIILDNQVLITDTYEGYGTIQPIVSLPTSRLSTTNLFQFKASGVFEEDQQAVAFMEATYNRKLVFNPNHLFHRFEMQEFGNFVARGLDSWQSSILLDQTNLMIQFPYQFESKNIFEITDEMLDHDLVITHLESAINIEQASLSLLQFKDFSTLNEQSNFVIVSHESLIGEELNNYKNYRESEIGGNYLVSIIDIDDLYHHFAYGIDKHPNAIRLFIEYAVEQWEIPIEHLFLVGKSMEYDKYRFNDVLRAQCLVPTYGTPGADFLLSAPNILDPRPTVPIGRFPATNKVQIANYLSKVQNYESQNEANCESNDIEWRKHITHIVSGNSVYEETVFSDYLNSLKPHLDTLQSGFYIDETFTKILPSQNESSLAEVINAGTGLITYMGHPTTAGTLYWQYPIESPENYSNYNRLPIINSNSCFSGNIHYANEQVMAEDYMFAPNRGSIGYIAIVNFGFPSYLNRFNSALYKHYAEPNQTIGNVMQQSIIDIFNDADNTSLEKGTTKTIHSLVYAGDPALQIGLHQQNDYAVDRIDILPSSIVDCNNQIFLQYQIENRGTSELDSIPLQFVISLQEEIINTIEVTIPNFNQSVQAIQSLQIPDLNDTYSISLSLLLDDNCNENNSIVTSFQNTICACEELQNPLENIPSDFCLHFDSYAFSSNEGTYYLNGFAIDTLFEKDLSSEMNELHYSAIINDCNYSFVSDISYHSQMPEDIELPIKWCVTNLLYINEFIGTPSVSELLNQWTLSLNNETVAFYEGTDWVHDFEQVGQYSILHYLEGENCMSDSLTHTLSVESIYEMVHIWVEEIGDESIEIGIDNENQVSYYQIFINGQYSNLGYAGNGYYTVKNLSPNTTYEISVIPYGNSSISVPCIEGETSNTVNATTIVCGEIELHWTYSLPDSVCLLEPEVILSTNSIAGIFDGNGVEDNAFIASEAGIGSHLIQYEVESDSLNCNYELTHEIEVFQNSHLQLTNLQKQCESPSQIVISATKGFNQYLWNDTLSSASSYFIVTENGSYSVQAEDELGCLLNDTMIIENYVASSFSAIDTIEIIHDFITSPYLLTSSEGVLSWNNIIQSEDYLVNVPSLVYGISDNEECHSLIVYNIEQDLCALSSISLSIANDSCLPQDATILIDSDFEINLAIILWNNDETGVSISELEAGNYNVSVMFNDCIWTADAEIFDYDVENDLFTTIVAEDDQATLELNETFTNVEWSTGDIGNTATFEPSSEPYWVMVTDENGCEITDTFFITGPTFVDKFLLELPIINNNSLLSLRRFESHFFDQLTEIEVYSIQGRSIINLDRNSNYELSVRELPVGMYIISFHTTNAIISTSFVKY